MPLVVMFHGGGGTAKTAAAATGWNRKADTEGFLVAYPQGSRRDAAKPAGFLRNPQFWNVEAGLSHAEHDGIDDVAFVRALLEDVASTYAVDPQRVHLCGFSNGASMALRAAVELSDRIASVAAVAGHLWNRERPPSRPVPLVYIVGARDPLAPPEGGAITSPWGRNLVAPPVLDTVATWARWLNCPSTARVDRVEYGVRRIEYGPGDDGAEVHYLLVEGAGHVWPGGQPVLAERYTGPNTSALDATDAIWRFFRRFVLRLDSPRAAR